MKKILSALAAIITIVLMTVSCAASHRSVSSQTNYYSGDGIPQKTEWRTCAVCNGRGTCSACKGTGKISGSTCKTCKGNGRCKTCKGQGGYEVE